MSTTVVTPITHIFKDWNTIPDVSHLMKIEDSYVKAAKGDIIYVSYIIEDDKVVAFGSAGYYNEEKNYYSKNHRQLWIEGLVSTVKGYGSIVLKELEEKLCHLADLYNVKQRIINVMSVEMSVGFYENNGYVECTTSSRFRGTGNIRLAKAIGNFRLETANVINYDSFNKYDIYGFIVTGRIKMLQKYVKENLNTIDHKQLTDYVLNNKDTIFNELISLKRKEKIIALLLEYKSR